MAVFTFDLNGKQTAPIFGVTVSNLNQAPEVASGDEFKTYVKDSLSRVLKGDAATESNVGALADNLTQRQVKIIEEMDKAPSYQRLFNVFTAIDPGAADYTVEYTQDQGEAILWRGQSTDGIPLTNVTDYADKFDTHWFVIAYDSDYFTDMSDSFAGNNRTDRKFKACVKVLDQAVNRAIWNGRPEANLYGVLTYPRLAKKVIDTSFVAGATPADVLGELFALVNYPSEQSGDLYRPDRLVTSPRVRNYLFNTARSTTSDTTIGQFFLDNQEFIKSIDSAHECKDAGGAGIDAALAYDSSEDSLSAVIPQSYTTLPTLQTAMGTMTVVATKCGGAAMWAPGGNILGLIPAV